MTIKYIITPEKENQKYLEILFKNLDLIQKNQEKILKNPNFYAIHVQGTGIAAMYIGNTRFYLGDLLRLWEKGIWKKENRYYYHVGGSPLSGMSFCKYWESEKGFQMVKNIPSFGTLAFPAWRMIQGIAEDEKGIPINKNNGKELESPLTIKELVKKLSNQL